MKTASTEQGGDQTAKQYNGEEYCSAIFCSTKPKTAIVQLTG